MSDALLSALASAKGEDDRAWVFLEASIEGLDEAVRDSLFAACIPHRFDASFLDALQKSPTAAAVAGLDRLVELGFAASDRRGGYWMHDETRRLVLRRMWQSDRKRFAALNSRAAAHLASLERDDAKRYAEFIYHAALDGSWAGRAGGVLDLVRETFPTWGGAPDFAANAVAIIPQLLAEHVEAGRLAGPVPETRELWRAMLDRGTGKTRVALALEGSGALCAYHAGVYEALHEADIEPDWIAGESMGAMIGAVIAGNPPERRVDQLRLLWSSFAQPSLLFGSLLGPLAEWFAVALGIPGLYRPNPAGPLLGGTAFYDLSPARATLERFVDFDRLNSGEIRYAAGAVDVATGNFTFFDNAHMRIGPDHVLASMALPPGFPAIQIDGRSYWDAALVSSTALQHVLTGAGDWATVVFQPYLFAVSERVPVSLNEVYAKQRAMSYVSRARLIADYYVNMQRMRQKLRHALERLPESAQTEEDRALLDDLVSQPRVSLVNLVYRRQAEDVTSATYNFDTTATAEHWARGRADAAQALGRNVLTTERSEDGGITIYDADMRSP
jgi:NTE family protein